MSIQIRGVQKHYKKEVIAFQDTTIKERITILYGENGVGKSTLLKAIAGLIHYNGQIETTLSFSYLSEFDYVQKDTTILEYMNLFLTLEDYNHDELIILLRQLHLDDSVDKLLTECSKGMLKKMYFILAIVLKRDCYLLDEPFSGVDKDSTKTMIEYIKTSTKMYVISTHNKEVLALLPCEVMYL